MTECAMDTQSIDAVKEDYDINHRSHTVPYDPPVDMERLEEGMCRPRALAIYVALVLYGVCALGYAYHRLGFIIATLWLASTYMLNQVLFLWTHTYFHTAFVELPQKKMNLLVLLAFLHHYEEPRVFPKNWLLYRLSYWYDPRAGSFTGFIIGHGAFAMGSALVLGTLDWTLAVTAVGMWWGMQNVQGMTHEWYHIHGVGRKTYCFHTRLFFETLELLGIIDTKRHRLHHDHGYESMSEVHDWMDMLSPGFFETLGDWSYKRFLNLHVHGKTYATERALNELYAVMGVMSTVHFLLLRALI